MEEHKHSDHNTALKKIPLHVFWGIGYRGGKRSCKQSNQKIVVFRIDIVAWVGYGFQPSGDNMGVCFGGKCQSGWFLSETSEVQYFRLLQADN